MTNPEPANPSRQINPQRVADARPDNWVDNYAPKTWRPYLRLMRADRPIGIWLLLWPCWWSVALAIMARGDILSFWPRDIWYLFLFAIGAIAMRGAGCTYNDIIDREFDAQVARTKSRPIPSGQVSVKAAVLFMIVLCLIGLIVLLQFNRFTIMLGIASLGIVALYPFMKRLTFWPQAILGAAFGWGALMGWAAIFGTLALPPLLLYAGTIAWVIGYDTIYAHQDKEDDALLGLKSTALKFGEKTKPWLVFFYGATIGLIGLAGLMAGAGGLFLLGLGLAALQLAWQVMTLDISDPDNCLARFKSNHHFGALVFAALLASILFS